MLHLHIDFLSKTVYMFINVQRNLQTFCNYLGYVLHQIHREELKILNQLKHIIVPHISYYIPHILHIIYYFVATDEIG